MFNFLDVSGNKALSNAEINRASKLLVFFSAVNGQEFNEAGVFGVMSSYAITPLLTKVILNNFDFDNSEDLKLEEILQDRESLFDLDFSNNDQIEKKLRHIVDEISLGSPNAIKKALKVFEEIYIKDNIIKKLNNALDELKKSDDVIEGVKAFKEKRLPKWK